MTSAERAAERISWSPTAAAPACWPPTRWRGTSSSWPRCPTTLRSALDAVLPPNWSRANPVDLIGDAPVERYVAALRLLLERAETRHRAVHARAHGDRAGGRHRRRAAAAGAGAPHAPAELLARRRRGARGAAPVPRRRHPDLRHARGGGQGAGHAGHLPPQPGAAARGAAGAQRRARDRPRRRARHRRPRARRQARDARTSPRPRRCWRRAASRRCRRASCRPPPTRRRRRRSSSATRWC